jgi:hypothetical protein
MGTTRASRAGVGVVILLSSVQWACAVATQSADEARTSTSALNGGATVIDFDAVDASAGPVTGAAVTAYLAGFGVSLSTNGDAALDIQQAPFWEPTSSSPNSLNVFGSSADLSTGVSYTLTLPGPVASVGFTRTGIQAGSTMGLWSATAYSASNQVLSAVGEGSIVSDVAPTPFILNGPGIAYVTFFSNVEGFAGTYLSIDDLTFTLSAPQLTLSVQPQSVWANGRAKASVVATLVDAQGAPIPKHSIAVAFGASGILLAPSSAGSDTTDSNGNAFFDATSNVVGDALVTASDLTDTSISGAQATVHFARHKLIVLVQGISTSLSCEGSTCSPSPPARCSAAAPSHAFDSTIATLLANGFSASDILWYSYLAGRVGGGQWVPNDYCAEDTGRTLRLSVLRLFHLIQETARANPNTDFYVVGHSLGGLIAFQSLGIAQNMPASTSLAGIVTFDGVLGGAPRPDVRVLEFIVRRLEFLRLSSIFLWKGPATGEVADLYDTATDHSQQGSTAKLLCDMLRLPECAQAGTNADAVANNANVSVETFGNSNDAVFSPSQCDLLLPGLVDAASSTQVVDAAGGGLFPLNGNDPQLGPIRSLRGLIAAAIFAVPCVVNSHTRVTLDVATTQRLAIVGSQD